MGLTGIKISPAKEIIPLEEKSKEFFPSENCVYLYALDGPFSSIRIRSNPIVKLYIEGSNDPLFADSKQLTPIYICGICEIPIKKTWPPHLRVMANRKDYDAYIEWPDPRGPYLTFNKRS